VKLNLLNFLIFVIFAFIKNEVELTTDESGNYFIESVTLAHTGRYICSAVNDAGEANADVVLQIFSKFTCSKLFCHSFTFVQFEFDVPTVGSQFLFFHFFQGCVCMCVCVTVCVCFLFGSFREMRAFGLNINITFNCSETMQMMKGIDNSNKVEKLIRD